MLAADLSYLQAVSIGKTDSAEKRMGSEVCAVVEHLPRQKPHGVGGVSGLYSGPEELRKQSVDGAFAVRR